MIDYRPMAQLPEAAGYKAGDVLVLIGELFGRGYANGLVDEARRIGMTVIGTTVGRRNPDGSLRCLTEEELTEAETILGGKIINVPLEAGIDNEEVDGQPSISEQLRLVKGDDWKDVNFSEEFLEKAVASGSAAFRANLAKAVAELDDMVQAGANLLVAHVMAGGFSRSRIFMVLLNRVFKGTGDKYLPSRELWESGIGRMCQVSFKEVTGETFRYLLEESAGLRSRIASEGGEVRYTAYGYHGTGVLLNGEYRWQSYIPYMPGWGKMRLEEIAAEATAKGIVATVFNCPEIQTNSSVLFLGVEIPLYRLLAAIKSKVGEELSRPLFECCQGMLAEGESLENMLEKAEAYTTDPLIESMLDFNTWPQHNTLEQAEMMLAASAELMAMHADQKQLVCAELSRIVFMATGRLILHASWKPEAPVLWLNHDIVAGLLADNRGNGIL
jgi:hypothetical protein